MEDIDQLIAGDFKPGREQMQPSGGIGRFTGDGIIPVEGIGIDADDTGDTHDHQKIIQDHTFTEGDWDFILVHQKNPFQ